MLHVASNTNNVAPRRLRGLDLVGVCLSGACLVHCTVLPLILALLPVFGSQFHLDERMHVLITILIVPVAALALVTGYLKHRQAQVLMLGGVALAMILGAPAMHESLGHLICEVLAAVGGVTLICAHLRNHSLLRGQCACGHAH